MTGTVVTAPGTVLSAIGGTVMVHVWVPEVIVIAVGTEWRAVRDHLHVEPGQDLGLGQVVGERGAHLCPAPQPRLPAVAGFPSTVADAVALTSPGRRPEMASGPCSPASWPGPPGGRPRRRG